MQNKNFVPLSTEFSDSSSQFSRPQIALINRDNSCCFSGYRPEKLPWGTDEADPRCVLLKDKIAAAAERIHLLGIRHFICGMARGGDMFFCEAVIALREKYPEISLEAAIPYERQASNWPEDERIRYDSLVGKCDLVTYVSREYTKQCMLRRNRYMVKNSSILLAVYDGKSGGTGYTVKHATQNGLEVVEIAP